MRSNSRGNVLGPGIVIRPTTKTGEIVLGTGSKTRQPVKVIVTGTSNPITITIAASSMKKIETGGIEMMTVPGRGIGLKEETTTTPPPILIIRSTIVTRKWDPDLKRTFLRSHLM